MISTIPQSLSPLVETVSEALKCSYYHICGDPLKATDEKLVTHYVAPPRVVDRSTPPVHIHTSVFRFM